MSSILAELPAAEGYRVVVLEPIAVPDVSGDTVKLHLIEWRTAVQAADLTEAAAHRDAIDDLDPMPTWQDAEWQ